MIYETKKLKKAMRETLDSNRYEHTIGVAYTAASLAMRYQYDMDKAFVAGLLHDCAKCIDNKEKLRMCKKNGIEITEIEERNPFLLHAKLGSFLAQNEYKIDDSEILDAITYHSTGRIDMTLLDKIIFIADYIEPERDKAPNLPALRELAFQNLDTAMIQIMHDTLEYLENTKAEIDILTQQAYDYYKKHTTDSHRNLG